MLAERRPRDPLPGGHSRRLSTRGGLRPGLRKDVAGTAWRRQGDGSWRSVSGGWVSTLVDVRRSSSSSSTSTHVWNDVVAVTPPAPTSDRLDDRPTTFAVDRDRGTSGENSTSGPTSPRSWRLASDEPAWAVSGRWQQRRRRRRQDTAGTDRVLTMDLLWAQSASTFRHDATENVGHSSVDGRFAMTSRSPCFLDLPPSSFPPVKASYIEN